MATGVLAFWLFDLGRFIALQAIVEHRDALLAFVARNAVVAALAFVAIYVACVAISFPGASVLTITGGFLFGTLMGGALAVIAATTGAAAIYCVARSSFNGGLARRAGPFLERFAQGFDRHAFRYLLSLRLAPLFPFWLVNLAPALIGMRMRDHLGATALGIIPGTFAFAAIGAGLDSVITSQRAIFEACRAARRSGCTISIDPGVLMTPEITAALLALTTISLLPLLMRALAARNA
jgi:uncharacterized membrane protein YdjX (TVP38/TMEM64 family)